MNQHYSHIAALTIAGQLGADVVIPLALQRDSFKNYFSQDPAKNRCVRGAPAAACCMLA
jgi:hypothetical protein